MSRSLLFAAALAGLPLTLAAAPAAAQPAGSYRQSCEDIRYSGTQLTATCGGLGGGARTTTINTAQCRGDIGNNNGVLSCAGATATNVRLEPNRTVRGGGDGRDRDRDRRGGGFSGSYSRSCSDVRVSGSTLTATCRTVRGGERTSQIEASRCRGDIGNNDGLLTCNGATATELRGRGGYDRDGRDRYNPYDRGDRNRYNPNDRDDRGRYDPYDRDRSDRYGYDRDGYDRDGYDRDGFDRYGYDRRGYDRYGRYRPR